MIRKTRSIEHYFSEQPKSNLKLGIVRTCLRGRFFEFLTASGVFSKVKVDLGSRLLIESMSLPKNGRVLDIGCGYGVVGVAAAVLNPNLYVILTDVNSRAVWLAKQNIEKSGVTNAEARHGCLYETVSDLAFNCILSNPPVTAGMETVKAIIRGASDHLLNNGTFQMVVKSKIAGRRLCSYFEESFGNFRVSARGSGYRVLMASKL